MAWDTFNITGKGPAILIVAAGDGPSLIIHNDTDGGFVLLGPDPGIGIGSVDVFPLGSQQYLGVDGFEDIYAIAAVPTDRHTVNIIPGGTIFFQGNGV